jgi:hypothetical protein
MSTSPIRRGDYTAPSPSRALFDAARVRQATVIPVKSRRTSVRGKTRDTPCIPGPVACLAPGPYTVARLIALFVAVNNSSGVNGLAT